MNPPDRASAVEAIVEHLVDVAIHTAREALPPVLAWLRGVTAEDVAVARPSVAGLPHAVVDRLTRAMSAWRAHPLAGDVLAFALDTAAAAAAAARGQERVELVWTGPDTEGARWRRSDQALVEVCDAARRRLVLTTFSASPGKELRAALQRAVDRNVDVWIVCETTKDSAGYLASDGVSAFGDLGNRVTRFVWPGPQRPTDASGHRGLLHAKVVVADDSVALVSSGNLSRAATERNIEAGVLVRGGPIPGALRGHIEALVRDKTLVKYDAGD